MSVPPDTSLYPSEVSLLAIARLFASTCANQAQPLWRATHKLQIESIKMVRDHAVTSVRPHLGLILLELREGSLLEGDGEGSDCVVVGTALQPRKDGLVDRLFQVVLDLVPLRVLQK